MIQKIAIIVIAVLLVSCSTVSATPTQVPASPTPIKPTSTSEAVSTPTVVEVAQQERPTDEPIARYNFLLLGGDFRVHRRGTGYGDKTDTMLLVSFYMTDPIKITVVQFPRNFYSPVEAMDDQWLFAVYRREGYEGLHYYFQEVFDLPLHGIAYLDMDNFIQFVDGLGGIWVDGGTNNGAAVLTYLRDNTNNWGCSSYDCEWRQFRVLKALAEKVKTKFHENAWVTTTTLWDAYGELFETDLSNLEQIHWLVELGWLVAMSDYEIAFEKLTESGYVEYGETPLNVRGWIAADDLHEWSRAILGGSYGR